MALITAQEVINLASPRNLDSGHILATDILAAEIDLIKNTFSADFYDALVANEDEAYTTFITTYVKPILAFGILANNWNRLRVAITDRGINNMTGEGVSPTQANDAKFEYQQRLSTLIADARAYVVKNYDFELIGNFFQEVTYDSLQPKRTNAL